MTHALLVTYLLALLNLFAPVGKARYGDLPETVSEREARYQDTAEAYAEAIESLPDAEFPFWNKKKERLHGYLSAYAVAVSFHEGGLLKSVDTGKRRGDGGASWCNFQVRLGRGRTREGWSGPDLAADRHKCAKAGIGILARAIRACSRLPRADWTASYASGRCQTGVPAARRHAAIAATALRMPIPPAPAPAERPEPTQRPEASR